MVPAAFSYASDEESPRARYLLQSSSSYLLMTLPRICLGVLIPPCMLTIWPSGPPPQTRSKHLLSSNLPKCPGNVVQLMKTSSQSKELRVLLFLYRSPSSHFPALRCHGLLGIPLSFNPTSKFLGVTFDRTLSFGAHV